MPPRWPALSALVVAAACSDPASGVDAPSSIDAAPADAARACSAELCIQVQDGATLPAGRLAIGWVPREGGPATDLAIAYDVAWTPADVTPVRLGEVTAPAAGYQSPLDVCAGHQAAVSYVVLSTDPNHDGAISSDEIIGGLTDQTVYGILQEVVVWLDAACPPAPPDFPEGLLAGTHVYTADQPVMVLDGELAAMATCTPGTPACDALPTPL